MWIGGQLGLTPGPNSPWHATVSHPGPDWSPTSMASEFLSGNRKFLPTSLSKVGENTQSVATVQRHRHISLQAQVSMGALPQMSLQPLCLLSLSQRTKCLGRPRLISGKKQQQTHRGGLQGRAGDTRSLTTAPGAGGEERHVGVSDTTRLLVGRRDWGGNQKWEQVSCFSPYGSRKEVAGLEAEAAEDPLTPYVAELGRVGSLRTSAFRVKLSQRAGCPTCSHIPLEIHDSPPLVMQASLKPFCSQRAQERQST